MAIVDLEQSFQRRVSIPVNGVVRRALEITDHVGTTKSLDPRPQLWAGWAPNYSKLLALREIDQTWQSFVDLVPKSSESFTHLDAGCGNGEIIARLMRRMPYTHIVGADLSREFLEETQRRIATSLTEAMGKVALHRVDLTQPLPFPEKTFRSATMNLVFQYLSSQEQEATVSNVGEVLEDGGKFYLSTFTQGHTFRQLVPGLLAREVFRGNISGVIGILPYIGIPRQFDRLRRDGVMNHPSVDDLNRMHKEAGFKNFEVAGPMFGEIGVFTVATK